MAERVRYGSGAGRLLPCWIGIPLQAEEGEFKELMTLSLRYLANRISKVRRLGS